MHESHHVNAQVAHEEVGPLQLQNIARLASLEAMQRFRSHDIKMPWEKGPLAPVFGAPRFIVRSTISFWGRVAQCMERQTKKK